MGSFGQVFGPPPVQILAASAVATSKTATAATVTFSNGSATITWTGHPLTVNSGVQFSTTGGLPTNFATVTTYYVTSVATNTFQVAATPGGTPIVAGSAGSGTQTGTAQEIILATIAIPANAMGLNGVLTIEAAWSYTNSANVKTLRTRLGATGLGATGTIYGALAPTTTNVSNDRRRIQNRGATNSQVGTMSSGSGSSGGGWGTGAAVLVTSALDTTAASEIVLTGQLATSTETMTLEAYLVTLTPG